MDWSRSQGKARLLHHSHLETEPISAPKLKLDRDSNSNLYRHTILLLSRNEPSQAYYTQCFLVTPTANALLNLRIHDIALLVYDE